MGWVIAREAVNRLTASAMICRGCEVILVTIHCLDVCARIPKDCWNDLENVPDDWVSARIVSDWAGSLIAEYCLATSVNIWRGCARASMAVHCFTA